MTAYKLKEECYLLRSCLIDARRMLLFMVEEVFLPVREVWLMPNVQRRGEVQSAEEKKGFVFFFWWGACCMACGILVPQPGIKPMSPALKADS